MYYPSKPFYSMDIKELKRYVNKMKKYYPMDNIKKRKIRKIQIRKFKTRKLRRRKIRKTKKILVLSFNKTKSLKHI